MKPVFFHRALDNEVEEAARFYENFRAGLGEELLSAIRQTTDAIRRAPSRCSLVAGDVRKRHLPRFPYALIFRDRTDSVLIIALAHNRCHPDYWKARVDPT